MERKKNANHSEQYELSFEETPEEKLADQSEIKDPVLEDCSEKKLQADANKEKELKKIREEIGKMSEEEKKKLDDLYDDGGIPEGTSEIRRYDSYKKEPSSRPMTKEEKLEADKKITAYQEREKYFKEKEERRKQKEIDDYWSK